MNQLVLGVIVVYPNIELEGLVEQSFTAGIRH